MDDCPYLPENSNDTTKAMLEKIAYIYVKAQNITTSVIITATATNTNPVPSILSHPPTRATIH